MAFEYVGSEFCVYVVELVNIMLSFGNKGL